jgi:anti-sigma factor RsiW
MLTCRELIDFLWRYVEDDLTPAERKTFDRHLAMCRSCRAYLDSYRKTIELGRVAFSDLDAEVPDDVPEELIQGILAARRA